MYRPILSCAYLMSYILKFSNINCFKNYVCDYTILIIHYLFALIKKIEKVNKLFSQFCINTVTEKLNSCRHITQNLHFFTIQTRKAMCIATKIFHKQVNATSPKLAP